MIVRLWRGWVCPADADAYEERLKTLTFPSYVARGVATQPGRARRRAVERVLTRSFVPDLGEEVEFLTVLEFDDMAAVHAFGGRDWETPTVPEAARQVLLRWDERSAHYETR